MANMNFKSIDAIAACGFQGFVKLFDLPASGCKDIPPKQGIYLVLRPLASFLKFGSPSTGGRFKGKDPTVPLDELENHWVEGAIVVHREGRRHAQHKNSKGQIANLPEVWRREICSTLGWTIYLAIS